MQSLVNSLSPAQIDYVLSAYDTVEAWFASVIDVIGDSAGIVIEDVML